MYQRISRGIASFRAGDTKFIILCTNVRTTKSRISPWRSIAAQNPLVRLLVLHTEMCVLIFSFIGLNAVKIDLSKVVYKNTQREVNQEEAAFSVARSTILVAES